MSQRIVRVRELLKRELGEIISRDFSFGGALVTVNDVDLTPDFRNGHVFLGVIGSDKQKREAIEKLEKRRGMIQKRIASRVVLKYLPQLHFKLDDSVERGVRVVSILENLPEIVETDDDEREEDSKE